MQTGVSDWGISTWWSFPCAHVFIYFYIEIANFPGFGVHNQLVYLANQISVQSNQVQPRTSGLLGENFKIL